MPRELWKQYANSNELKVFLLFISDYEPTISYVTLLLHKESSMTDLVS